MGKDTDNGPGLKLKRVPRVDDLAAQFASVSVSDDNTDNVKNIGAENTGIAAEAQPKKEKKRPPALSTVTNISEAVTNAPLTTGYTRRSPITTFAQAAKQIGQETDAIGVREAFIKRERMQVELRSDPLAPPRQKLKLAGEDDSPAASPKVTSPR